MDERIVQFRIGVVVLATFIITLILLAAFGETPWPFQRRYTVKILFPEAPGVAANSPIRKSGVLIGRVTHVKLNEDDTVTVTAEIDADKPLYTDNACRISWSPLGDSKLEIVKIPEKAAVKEPLEPGGQLPGQVGPDPIQLVADLQGDIGQTIKSVGETSDELRRFVARLGGVLGDEEEMALRKQRLEQIVDSSLETMESVRRLAQSAEGVLGDPQTKAKIDEAVSEVPQLLREMRGTLDRLNETITLANRNLEHIEDFTRPLGERGETVVARLDQGAQKLDTLLDEMVTFSRALNSREGSLGQLIHNPDLYQNLDRAATNIEELTRQLRPVVQDVRVFSDKIARHPELLGVRGAMERSPGTKGVPQTPWLRRE